MLTAELQEQFANNRRSERPQTQIAHIYQLLSQNQYENLIVNLLEYCQSLELTGKTTFLGKTYLDIVLDNSNFIELDQLPITLLCCVWIATKFNQPASVWEGYTTEVVCQHGHYQFTPEQLVDREQEILQLLDFQFNFTTPFDYMIPFFQTFPWLGKAKLAVEEVIALAVTLPELSSYSSEDLFYGSFLSLCEIKQLKLTILQQSVLASQIVNWDNVIQIRTVLTSTYNQISALGDTLETRDII